MGNVNDNAVTMSDANALRAARYSVAELRKEREALRRDLATVTAACHTLRSRIEYLGSVVGTPDAAVNYDALVNRLAALMLVAGWPKDYALLIELGPVRVLEHAPVLRLPPSRFPVEPVKRRSAPLGLAGRAHPGTEHRGPGH